MNRLGAILYGLAIGAVVLLFVRESVEPAIWLVQERAGDTFAPAVTGWLIATLGPVALSMCVWLITPRLKARWPLHLVLIPAAILMFRQGSLLFFDGVKVSGDNLPGGYALLMAMAFLLVTLLAHTTALIVQAYRTIAHRANRG